MKTFSPSIFDSEYQELEVALAKRIESFKGYAFTQKSENDLYNIFLHGLPYELRKHHQCRACEQFVNKYGHLVAINDYGVKVPLMWDIKEAPPPFFRAVQNCITDCHEATIIGVFNEPDEVWGRPKTGMWSHLHGAPLRIKRKQCVQDEFNSISNVLSEFTSEVLLKATRILELDALYRSEAALGAIKWLLDLKGKAQKSSYKSNYIWKAVAEAPPGFTHIRANIGYTLLTDLKMGMDFEIIKKRWADKLHPLQYQRPTAPVKEQTIIKANKIFEELKAAKALERRYAKLEELHCLWKPEQAKIPLSSGPFSFLKTEAVKSTLDMTSVGVKWSRFQTVILPQAKKIELLTPLLSHSYFGMVTAVHADAPAILQWDTLPRNPFSWYHIFGRSTCEKWNIKTGWTDVTGICTKPHMWYHPMHFGNKPEGVMFVLKGCIPTFDSPGGMFFPEILKSEFHEIRSVMEAYAAQTNIQGRHEGTANGIAFGKDSDPIKLRVNGVEYYTINSYE